ncbi:pentatricopeptide repeat-containing protein at5g55840 [Phtheirospermum japonicum]|uniref:Pentatricopeptide repeat-containing protein at5g55840 n=1 Tax=Phtheirospermum japonicum TaxID=374723 RepID=A0A830CYS3_9LAMI|nr:pentatricopeptide repeat-containing protein at5g55840 [Phtheirospermum japonicum]
MKSVKIPPGENTFASLFNGLKRNSCFQESHFLLHEMLKNGFVPSERQYSSLIMNMFKNGNIQGAFKLKDEMEALSVVSSCHVAESAMVRGLVQNGKTEEGLFLLKWMLRRNIVPTVPTFTDVIHVLCKEGKLSEALGIKVLMEKHGARPDVVTYNVIITALCREGDVARAFEFYEELEKRNVCANTTTFSILGSVICNENDCVRGKRILNDLEERGLVSGDSSAQAWNERLSEAMANIDLLRRKSPRRIAMGPPAATTFEKSKGAAAADGEASGLSWRRRGA